MDSEVVLYQSMFDKGVTLVKDILQENGKVLNCHIIRFYKNLISFITILLRTGV